MRQVIRKENIPFEVLIVILLFENTIISILQSKKTCLKQILRALCLSFSFYNMLGEMVEWALVKKFLSGPVFKARLGRSFL